VLLADNAPQTGVFLFELTKLFGFIRCRVAVLFLSAVIRRRTASEVLAEFPSRLLGFLEQFDDLLFGELARFYRIASLSSLRLGG